MSSSTTAGSASAFTGSPSDGGVRLEEQIFHGTFIDLFPPEPTFNIVVPLPPALQLQQISAHVRSRIAARIRILADNIEAIAQDHERKQGRLLAQIQAQTQAVTAQVQAQTEAIDAQVHAQNQALNAQVQAQAQAVNARFQALNDRINRLGGESPSHT
ncbi:hypothetical protein VTL71DRAFT_3706 [Oculimacula yallundae]|uniref:Uncharacterized protein n=1 Tax=Oculimacula yallundae TaxID=86028 RepID=A0ABR4C3T3_9HELO